jgi:hypothetical protein
MSDTNTVLAEISRHYSSMAKFDKLGGADTFFGRLYVFEEMLQEQHDAAGEGHGNGMYSYHGMCQYGNIVCYEPTVVACHIFTKELGYSLEQLEEIRAWYEGHGSVDCAMAHACISSFLRGKDPMIKKILEKADEKSNG